MQLSPSQLEWLVQQVVDQLRAAGVSTGGPPSVDRSSGGQFSGNQFSGNQFSGNQPSGPPAEGRSADSRTAPPPALRLDQPLVSLADLPDTLPAAGSVELGRRTVVTPAALDRLRQAGLTTTRLTQPAPSGSVSAPSVALASSLSQNTATTAKAATSDAPPLPRLRLLGSAPWWPSLQRSRWPDGVELSPIATSYDALTAQLAGISPDAHQSMVVVADEAYRLLWDIQQRHRGWCGCVVRDWHELQQVCQQLPANLLVLPTARWQPAAVGNLIRHWHRHRQTSLAEGG